MVLYLGKIPIISMYFIIFPGRSFKESSWTTLILRPSIEEPAEYDIHGLSNHCICKPWEAKYVPMLHI